MSLSTILKILANCFICDSHSKCGNRREDSDSVKQHHKKRVRKKNSDMKLDEDDLYML